MLDYRSTVAAAAFAGAVLVGCTDPDLPTDLRTSGPPNVTTVTVMSDLESAADPARVGIGRIVESATYCRLQDDKRPGIVGLPDIRIIQVCPDDLSKPADEAGVAEGVPPQWFVRVVFDKLLDAKIEDLVPQLDSTGAPTGVMLGTFLGPNMTQPVTLQCNGVDVPYNGYYVPNGNKQSWPLGPSLFVAPLAATSVPVGASCTVSVKDIVHNKGGQSVPTDQRSYNFKLAPMALRFSNPAPTDGDPTMPGSITVSPTTPVDFFFTAQLKSLVTLGTGTDALALTTLNPALVKISSAPNLNISTANPDGDPDPTVCSGSGTPVDPATIRSYLRGSVATSTALIMSLDVGGPTATSTNVWQPNTTYLVEFGAGAAVTPFQGGADGTFPSDFSLCFHTTAATM